MFTGIKIASNLYHKWKKEYSFKILEKSDEIVVKNNPLTNVFNTIAHFFLYSLITIITAANKNDTTIFIQLLIIYSVCFVVIVIEFFNKASFKIVISKMAQSIKIKNEVYSIKENELEISDRSVWFDDDNIYGLYLKNINGTTKLMYGYSILKDIQQLKFEIELRIAG